MGPLVADRRQAWPFGTEERVESVNRIDSDEGALRTIHDRWLRRRNRSQESSEYRDEWYGEQCLHCRFYIPLQEPLGFDYGACANPASPFDGRVMFEHDGCNWFALNEAYDMDSASSPQPRQAG
jgi:hypothetical protein